MYIWCLARQQTLFHGVLRQAGWLAVCQPLLERNLDCQVMLTYPLVTCRYMRNITIPAAFITATAGDALKDLLKSDDGEPKEVVAVMDWNDVLPRAEKVSWEFWSNSNDQCGPLCDVQKEFIKVSWAADLVGRHCCRRSWWWSYADSAILRAFMSQAWPVQALTV